MKLCQHPTPHQSFDVLIYLCLPTRNFLFYSMGGNILLSYLTLVLKLFLIWPVEGPSSGLLCPFDTFMSFLEPCLALTQQGDPDAYFPCPRCGISHFSRESWFFSKEKCYLEAQILTLAVLIDIGLSLPPSLLCCL